MKKLILFSSLFIGSLSAMEQSFKFKQSSVRASQSLGNVELVRNEQGFHVVQDDERYAVKNYFVDPLLRNASKKSLKKFQKAGYIEVKKLDNEDFVLRAKVRGLGGGPILAGAFYWLTKATCYGGAIAAAGAAVGATGGGAIAVAAAGEVVAVGGSSVAAVVIGSSATLTTAATTATTGGLLAASAGGVATVVTGIETAAVFMGALGMAIPFL